MPATLLDSALDFVTRRPARVLALALGAELALDGWSTAALGVPAPWWAVSLPFALALGGLAFFAAWLARGAQAPWRACLGALAAAELARVLLHLFGSGAALASSARPELAGWFVSIESCATPLLWALVFWRGLARALGPPTRSQWMAERGLLGACALGRALGSLYIALFVLQPLVHSERLPTPKLRASLAQHELDARAWPRAGSGYWIADALPPEAERSGLDALAALRGARIAPLALGTREQPAAGVAEALRAFVDAHQPGELALVLPAEQLRPELVAAVNDALVPLGARCPAFGFLPVAPTLDLGAYVRELREFEARRAAERAPLTARVVAEVGRSISPACKGIGQGLVDALGAAGARAELVRFDNTLARALPAAELAALCDADLWCLIGHGSGDRAAGIEGSALPIACRSARTVVDGTCYGAYIANPAGFAGELWRRGTLAHAGGSDINGISYQAGFLAHAWASGASAGEAMRRNLIELERALAAEPGALDATLIALRSQLRDWRPRAGFEQALLLGDPAFVPFPLAAGATRARLCE